MIHSTATKRIAAIVLASGALLLGAAALRAQNPVPLGSPYGDLREVTLQGKLVALQDELARKYGAKANPAAEKQWAIALPDGHYYTFLDTPDYRKLVAARPESRAVEVKARLFPRSQILEVLSYQSLAAEQVKRRYYCSVCAIYADDFGPCACCGRELELLPLQAAK